MKRILIVTLMLISTTLGGCLVAPRHHQVHHGHGNVVVVKKGHVHGKRCGHYRHNGRWHAVRRGHAHGKRCGHHFVGGVWVIRKG